MSFPLFSLFFFHTQNKKRKRKYREGIFLIEKYTPCRNCFDRHTGCHDSCEEYNKFTKNKEKIKKARHDYYLDLKLREKHFRRSFVTTRTK